MIRITVEETNDTVCLIVEGKVSGPWVQELESVARKLGADCQPKPLEIDLSGVAGVDAAGRSLLIRMRDDGVTLRNLDPLTESLLKMDVAA